MLYMNRMNLARISMHPWQLSHSASCVEDLFNYQGDDRIFGLRTVQPWLGPNRDIIAFWALFMRIELACVPYSLSKLLLAYVWLSNGWFCVREFASVPQPVKNPRRLPSAVKHYRSKLASGPTLSWYSLYYVTKPTSSSLHPLLHLISDRFPSNQAVPALTNLPFVQLTSTRSSFYHCMGIIRAARSLILSS